MIKVMIVEDEPLALMGIKSLVDWNQYNYDLIHTAVNGKDAIEKIKIECPNIVLTDLMMDEMDGFELMNYCQLNYPQIKFIVLSNYNDFDNVRKAMRCGAVDYIFKLTVKKEEILAVLQEAAVEITKCIEIQKKTGSKELLHINMSYQNLVVDTNSEIQIMFLFVENMLLNKINKEKDIELLLNFTIQNVLVELLDEQYQFELFQYYEGRYILAFNTKQENCEHRIPMKTIYTTIQQILRRIFDFHVTGVLSRPFYGLKALKKQISQYDTIVDALFFKESSNLYILEDLAVEGNGPSLFNKEYEETLKVFMNGSVTALVESDYRRFLQQIEQMRNQFPHNQSKFLYGTDYMKKREVIGLLREFYKKLYAAFEKKGINIDIIINKHGVNLEDCFLYYDYFGDILGEIQAFAYKYVEKCSGHKGKKYRKEVEFAKEYVEKNMENKIALGDLVEQLCMSESRFSHLFKEEMNISFMEYVLKVKTNRAMELLRDTDLSIKEIANRIGTENQNYFSNQFKKKTGMSPLQYRKKRWNEEIDNRK